MTRQKPLKILIANGVNLDLLGSREPDIYGKVTLAKIKSNLIQKSAKIKNLKLDFFQTNSEFEFLKKIAKPYSGIILNAGAWTHTSLAIADRLRAVQTPFVEVHLSDTNAREEFRKFSFTAEHAIEVIKGEGARGYERALKVLLEYLLSNS